MRMFGQNNSEPVTGRSLYQTATSGVAYTGSFGATVVLAPTVNNNSAPFFYQIASANYPEFLIEPLMLAWLLASFAITFFFCVLTIGVGTMSLGARMAKILFGNR